MRVPALAVLLTMLPPLTGCSPQPDTPMSSPAPDVLTPAEVALEVRSIAEFEDLVASHAGQVVVVDLWALW